MTGLPLTVIGGYLGAGKTTLINQVLGAAHGLRLAVLVNDFGAINIDAALLQSATEDTIELTNGCICCTMSGDLFFTIGDLLDRDPRPDHILIEASGIGDPAKIAAVSLAEKELRYAGIITVADGLNIAEQLSDPRISEQVKSQLRSADLVVVSKIRDFHVGSLLQDMDIPRWAYADDLETVAALMLDRTDLSARPASDAQSHPAYLHWSDTAPPALSREDIYLRLSDMPPGLLRLKALVPDKTSGFWEVHVVGRQKQVRRRDDVASIGLVAIGLNDALSQAEIRRWWLGT
ncbi:GTP-binding protein [uncultured Tateyamaria sp.]|uniref:CobW family GTP-binding protein n=1 Tax=uncultured Tateyamaria sp. TaxID=455651 RepID=UPI002615307B|nr:GTP-binding protein [uncultured Tateyamaria sp.]